MWARRSLPWHCPGNVPAAPRLGTESEGPSQRDRLTCGGLLCLATSPKLATLGIWSLCPRPTLASRQGTGNVEWISVPHERSPLLGQQFGIILRDTHLHNKVPFLSCLGNNLLLGRPQGHMRGPSGVVPLNHLGDPPPPVWPAAVCGASTCQGDRPVAAAPKQERTPAGPVCPDLSPAPSVSSGHFLCLGPARERPPPCATCPLCSHMSLRFLAVLPSLCPQPGSSLRGKGPRVPFLLPAGCPQSASASGFLGASPSPASDSCCSALHSQRFLCSCACT